MLLALGGDQVVPPLTPDPLIDLFSCRGRLWASSTTVRFVPDQWSACHDNAVALWRSGEASAVATGYALSEDGLWREHSWAIAHDGELLETTEPRMAYFGVELRNADAERLAAWVDGGAPPRYPRSFGYSRLPKVLVWWIASRIPRRSNPDLTTSPTANNGPGVRSAPRLAEATAPPPPCPSR